MRLRVKLFLSIALLVLLFLSGLFILNHLHRDIARQLLQQLQREYQVTFDKAVELHSQPLVKMLLDYTYWDDTVSFLRSPNPDWARDNLDELLATHGFDALWAYRPDGRLVYSRWRPAPGEVAPGRLELPGEVARLADARRRQFFHFFLETPDGLLEVRGDTVHPTDDPERRTPPHGTLFVGRLWSEALLRELREATRSEIHLGKAEQAPTGGPDLPPWTVAFERPLHGYDGRQLAVLRVSARVRAIGDLIAKSSEYLLIASLFALLLLALLWLAMAGWIYRPLRAVIRGLDRHDPQLLEPLATRGDEFGRLSNLILRFFDQQRELAEHASARQWAEEQLRQSQKLEAVGRLAGGIAHDFNNLLTVILGYSELLLAEQERPGQPCHSGRQIRLAAEQAAGLTRQLLAFGRKQILQPARLDLHELLGEMESMLRRVIAEDIRIELRLLAPSPTIVADRAQFSQVILNLALNARDAMPQGGHLLIETGNAHLDDEYVDNRPVVKVGDYVRLDISDSGTGMDAETMDRIFEPFFTTKEKGRGTGLGLATVYGIVKQSGGYIWVYSDVGHGTVFKIYLPLAADAFHPAPPAAPGDRARGGGETVLVVEDKPELLNLVRNVLEGGGYTVLAAVAADEALGISRAQPRIDLLLTDVVMPGMDGPSLAKALLRERPGLRVLYMSGYTDNSILLQQILEAGQAFLQKPFTAQDLKEKVRDTLDR